jgi:uncharacterized membrane protein
MVKIKLTPQKINQYLYLLIAVIASVATLLITLFLYKNFYKTITQSAAIIILKGKVAPEMIDVNKFNNIIDNLNKKTETRELGEINNPFK